MKRMEPARSGGPAVLGAASAGDAAGAAWLRVDFERLAVSALIGLVVLAGVSFLPGILNDGDTWWHLAAGEWILREGAVPSTDPFSHSAPGVAWHAHEWAPEILMRLAYVAAGWSGVMLLTGVCAGAAAAVVCHAAQRRLAPLPAVALTLLAVTALLPSLLARPHLIVAPLLVLWTAVLLSARDKGRVPAVAWAGLMLLWANMHASFLLGLGIAAAFGLEALLAAAPGERLATARRWAIFGAASLACALVTPYGLGGFLYPLQVSGMEILPYIDEWSPTVFYKSDTPTFTVVFFAYLAAAVLSGARFPPVRAVLFLGLLFLALSHARHQYLFAAVGGLLLAAPLAQAVPALARRAGRGTAADKWAVLAVVLVALVSAGARIAVPTERTDSVNAPLTALAAVPEGVRRTPVFNTYGYGGVLIFHGVRPFVDGRGDMYGDAFMKRFLAAERAEPAAVAEVFRRHGIRWTFLHPDSPLVAFLDRAPGWTRLYADAHAVVHVRRPSAEPGLDLRGPRA